MNQNLHPQQGHFIKQSLLVYQ